MDKLIKNGTTLYKQVAQSISSAITSGEFPPNTKLPTQAQLCAQFQVSRITIGTALDILESQGVLKKKAGMGTFVCPKTQINSCGLERKPFWSIDSIMQWTHERSFILKGIELVDSPENYKQLLKTKHMVCVKGIRKAENIPFAFVQVYVDMASVIDRPGTDFIQTQVIEMVEAKTRKKAAYIEQIVSAITAKSNWAVAQDLLITTKDEPIVCIESRYKDKNGECMAIIAHYINSKKWKYSFLLPRESKPASWLEGETGDNP